MHQFESTDPAKFRLGNGNGIRFRNLRTSASFLRKNEWFRLFFTTGSILVQPLLQSNQRWLSWDLKWESWALRTYKVSTELCWNSPPAGRDAQLWWRQLDRGPNQYPEIIEADWAGLWHYYIIGWSLVSKNIMNLTIKYPRFNKNIRKSQVVTWPKSRPVIGLN